VNIPADQCPRISKGFLAAEERAMGRRYFDQEYKCSFESIVDAYFDSVSIQAALVDADSTLDLGPIFGGQAGGGVPPADDDVVLTLDGGPGGIFGAE
jgi:hypothetical protein